MSVTRLASICVLILAAIAPAAAPAATVYDLAADFSIGSNPNGAWTYGQYTGGLNPGNFVAFTTPGSALGGYAGLEYWNTGGNIDPNIEYNSTGSDIVTGNAYGDITFRSHEVAFGPYFGPTVARFTAQTSGLYAIAATFQTVQVANGAPNAYVFGDGGSLFSSIVPDGLLGQSVSFSGTEYLAAGAHIDFVVWGGDGNNKTTQVEATLSAVPEPASVLMCTVGSITAFGAYRRRRRVQD